MNIREHREAKLLEYLEKLNLGQKNVDLAAAYLSSDPEDLSILEQMDHVDLKRTMYQTLNTVEKYMAYINKLDDQQMRRFYRIMWAIGKSTAGFVLTPYWGEHRGVHHDLRWRVEVLGKAAVASLELERFAMGNLRRERMQWLYELAKLEPAAIEEAQTHKGTVADNMKTVAAALVVCGSKDIECIRRNCAIILENSMDTLDKTLNWLSPTDIQALAEYIQKGDLDAPIPVELPQPTAANALLCRHGDGYLVRMLGFCSFMAMGKDARARCAFRIYARINPHEALMGATYFCPADHYLHLMEELLQDLPGGSATMLQWMGYDRQWIDENAKRAIMRRCLGGVAEAMKYVNPGQYMTIIKYLPEAEKFQGDEKERIITLLNSCITRGRDTVQDFLLANGSLKNSKMELDAVTARSYVSPSHAAAAMVLYRMDYGWDDFLCRCGVVLGAVFDGNAFSSFLSDMKADTAMKAASNPGVYCYAVMTPENLERFISELIAREVPLTDVLNYAGLLHEHEYDEKLKKEISIISAKMVRKYEYIAELSETAKNGNLFARLTAIRTLYDLAPDHPDAKLGVLAAAGESAKAIKAELVKLYVAQPEWVEDYQDLLNSKKAAVRQLAVEVLGRLGEREALEAALANEKNAKVADAIRAVLGAEAAPVSSGDDLAAELIKGNKLKKLTWLLNAALPALHKKDGTEAGDTVRSAILVSYCELGRIGRSDTAAQLAAELDTGDLEKLALRVYDIWYADGAQSRHKWVLPFACVYGGAAITARLTKVIHDWPEHQRGAIACDAVMALALSSDPAAIVIVDSISRKFKFRQVKTAAAQALENAASELGISAEELADRIVPDLGFGKDGKRTFDYGKRSFTVRLIATLELEITNDQGKAVKNMPAPGKTDDPQAADAYEDFKTMKKQIKTTVTAQRARLEAALSVLRCWDTDRWKALFVDNPIMHQFAMSLIWGIYEDGKLTDTFRYMEDGSFNTVDEDEFDLPENAKIGLVHPVELDEETLEGWKQQLEDHEIKQSIEQLDRTVHTLDESRAGEKSLEDFGGKQLNALSLSGKMLGQGWYRGSVQDGGAFYCFWREDKDLGIGAELRFSGTAVGYDDGENVTVYDAVFYRGTVSRGSYVYDTLQNEQLVPLGEVPTRYYSEIVHQITRATASSTECDADWKKNRHDQ